MQKVTNGRDLCETRQPCSHNPRETHKHDNRRYIHGLKTRLLSRIPTDGEREA
jgi:hypothetical protein